MIKRYYPDYIIQRLADKKTRAVRVRRCSNCTAEKLTGLVALSEKWTAASPLICPNCNTEEEVRIVKYMSPGEVKEVVNNKWSTENKKERFRKMSEFGYGVYRFECTVCKLRWSAVEVNLFGRIDPPLSYCANCEEHKMVRLRNTSKKYDMRMRRAKRANLRMDLSDLLERKRRDDPTTSPLIAKTERDLGLATGVDPDPDFTP